MIMTNTMWKNNLNIAKDTPVVYVNIVIIFIIDFEKKIRDFSFVPTFAFHREK